MKNRYSENVRNGNVMSLSMQKKLFAYLGVKYRAYNIGLIIIFIILFSIFALFFLYLNLIAFIVFVCVVGAMVIVYSWLLSKRMNKYIEDLLFYYNNRFSDYLQMKRIYTYTRGEISGLEKESVIFFSDGYYFYIFDDLLKPTNIMLGRRYKTQFNRFPVLKIYDDEVIHNEPFTFRLKDIYCYELIGNPQKEYSGNIKEEFFHVFSKEEKTNFLKITFDDFKSIEVGANLYYYFKEILPLKEKLDDEPKTNRYAY